MARSKRTDQSPARISPAASLGNPDLGIRPPASIELDENHERLRAYERYLERAGHEGSPEADWLEAERELRERRWNGLG
jgi:hypothetical protein